MPQPERGRAGPLPWGREIAAGRVNKAMGLDEGEDSFKVGVIVRWRLWIHMMTGEWEWEWMESGSNRFDQFMSFVVQCKKVSVCGLCGEKQESKGWKMEHDSSTKL